MPNYKSHNYQLFIPIIDFFLTKNVNDGKYLLFYSKDYVDKFYFLKFRICNIEKLGCLNLTLNIVLYTNSLNQIKLCRRPV